jgi:hypothetical protein
MKVLIGCEYSGIIREAFKARGHDAWSCDIVDTEIPGQHIKDDVLKHLNDGWDFAIFHPPCTYLSTVGNKLFKEIYYFNVNLFDKIPLRQIKQALALVFFLKCYNAKIPKICVENPQGRVNTLFRQPDQMIHPYMFGDPEFKRTCLWLKGLPKLITEENYDIPKPIAVYSTGKNKYFIDKHHNAKLRSKTFPGIARAMAEQWG